MAQPSGSGGTSLAPTPTHPHHLSRESSREELEMAESLRRLNQVQDTHMSNMGSSLREQQPGTPQDDQKSEIYHSLEDAVPIAGAPASPAPTASVSLPPRSVGGSNAPIVGQVCRYVSSLASDLSVNMGSDWGARCMDVEDTDTAQQLQNNPDAVMASFADRRDCV